MATSWNITNIGGYKMPTVQLVASSFKVEVLLLELFTKADFRTSFFDINNNLVGCEYFSLAGSDYTNWQTYNGDRDAYIYNLVSKNCGLTATAASV